MKGNDRDVAPEISDDVSGLLLPKLVQLGQEYGGDIVFDLQRLLILEPPVGGAQRDPEFAPDDGLDNRRGVRGEKPGEQGLRFLPVCGLQKRQKESIESSRRC